MAEVERRFRVTHNYPNKPSNWIRVYEGTIWLSNGTAPTRVRLDHMSRRVPWNKFSRDADNQVSSDNEDSPGCCSGWTIELIDQTLKLIFPIDLLLRLTPVSLSKIIPTLNAT